MLARQCHDGVDAAAADKANQRPAFQRAAVLDLREAGAGKRAACPFNIVFGRRQRLARDPGRARLHIEGQRRACLALVQRHCSFRQRRPARAISADIRPIAVLVVGVVERDRHRARRARRDAKRKPRAGIDALHHRRFVIDGHNHRFVGSNDTIVTASRRELDVDGKATGRTEARWRRWLQERAGAKHQRRSNCSRSSHVGRSRFRCHANTVSASQRTAIGAMDGLHQ